MKNEIKIRLTNTIKSFIKKYLNPDEDPGQEETMMNNVNLDYMSGE